MRRPRCAEPAIIRIPALFLFYLISFLGVRRFLLGMIRHIALGLRLLFKAPTQNFIIQLFRYCFVGGASFVIDFGLLIFLTEIANIYYLISASISFTIGLLANYFLSVRWVFNSTTENPTTKNMEFFLFAAIGIIGLGLNAIVIRILTEKFSFYYAISKLFSTIIVFLWNFLARRTMFSNFAFKWIKRNQQQL